MSDAFARCRPPAFSLAGCAAKVIFTAHAPLPCTSGKPEAGALRQNQDSVDWPAAIWIELVVFSTQKLSLFVSELPAPWAQPPTELLP